MLNVCANFFHLTHIWNFIKNHDLFVCFKLNIAYLYAKKLDTISQFSSGKFKRTLILYYCFVIHCMFESFLHVKYVCLNEKDKNIPQTSSVNLHYISDIFGHYHCQLISSVCCKTGIYLFASIVIVILKILQFFQQINGNLRILSKS